MGYVCQECTFGMIGALCSLIGCLRRQYSIGQLFIILSLRIQNLFMLQPHSIEYEE